MNKHNKHNNQTYCVIFGSICLCIMWYEAFSMHLLGFSLFLQPHVANAQSKHPIYSIDLFINWQYFKIRSTFPVQLVITPVMGCVKLPIELSKIVKKIFWFSGTIGIIFSDLEISLLQSHKGHNIVFTGCVVIPMMDKRMWMFLFSCIYFYTSAMCNPTVNESPTEQSLQHNWSCIPQLSLNNYIWKKCSDKINTFDYSLWNIYISKWVGWNKADTYWPLFWPLFITRSPHVVMGRTQKRSGFPETVCTVSTFVIL